MLSTYTKWHHVTFTLSYRLKPAGIVNAHIQRSVCVISPRKHMHKGAGRVKSYNSCIMTAPTHPMSCILPYLQDCYNHSQIIKPRHNFLFLK